ncbi:uncharacterized protein LOC131029556 [Cryptomeria japonica]|uniref:uncharacterized protein LOC131029556 n=1 Tax=Cryptomeria japonica TaxID=3369 RepID=UPI0025AC9673|nr:uncharacterized protein LOC131029556 [Cryptomeria japonica]XP_057816058.1 uncharacterized protein LOC131029556 [Cryptomeria japonica]
MQHTPTTIEEQIIVRSIQEECQWENLPKRLQIYLSSKEEWHKRVKEHCIKKRLQWSNCFARKTCKENEYYEDMMNYLRKNLALFPYHLAEYVCRIMRISPFRYYCDMLYEVMKNEQPYDRIPNFSAADALRLTGIGRNEFIDIMNKCRAKKIMWKINKSIVKEFLPTEPVDFPIEPWWGVCLVNFTLEEFRKLTEDEMATIDKICKEEANLFVLFDPQIILGLYRRGLVYFDVPVYPDDRFKVSKLEGFVSNREQSYEDPTEELLYAVFVVSSEHATVAELATTLQADLPHLQAAASFACRLGWAIKVLDPTSVLQDSSMPGSPNGLINDDEDGTSLTGLSIENPLGEKNSDFSAGGGSIDSTKTSSSSVRVAFIVDANITSYLMMGSVSPGLKSHAVTLYEAGKLGDASIAELCNDLLALEGTKFEGELQEFANHASSLRCVLECLQSGGLTTDTTDGDVSDLIDALSSKSAFSDGENPRKSIGNSNFGQELQLNGSGNNNFHWSSFESGISQMDNQPFESKDPLPESNKAVDRSSEHYVGQLTKVGLDAEKEENSLSSTYTSINSKNRVKRKRKYRVDVLRCESLAGLAPPTLHRLFRRDYDIIVSMIPLPSSPSVILPGGASPVHFGPPSYSSMTPWMKLILYSVAGSGPVSVVLMKGQRIRLLPPPLSRCEKALLWAWDGSTVGGLGGRFDGTLVNGNILLHCLNSLLKISAVLVLPLLKVDLNESGKPITKDIPLPLINRDGSCTIVNNEIGLSTEEIAQLNSTLTILAEELQFWTIGYLRLIKIHRMEDNENHSAKNAKCEWVPLSIEFGIPLFSPELCRSICQRVIQSELLQANSLSEHREAMQKLRKRLRDFCAEYHVTGPIAKLIYAREHSTRDASPMLTTYASGRWDPFVEPPSPWTASHKKLTNFDRQKRRSEILSFDGDILRSFALTPVYQPGTRLVEEYGTSVDVTSEASSENSDDNDSIDVILPGVNLLFDGSLLRPFDIGTCLQGRLPVSLIAEASMASTVLQSRTN